MKKQGTHVHPDVRWSLRSEDPSSILADLSPDLSALLPDRENLSPSIVALLATSEVIFQRPDGAGAKVFRIGDAIAVKFCREPDATVELASLKYLKHHLPNFPAPRPHGLVRFHPWCLLFTSYVPGLDLEKAWAQLDDAQKRRISGQLDVYFAPLRLLPLPENGLLGGVDGSGCKDGRRFVRVSSEPITDSRQFEDFIFTGSTSATPTYTGLLRRLLPTSPARCCFTHADVRPANIMVEKDSDGNWNVTAVVDWTRSGFYPEYWESIKATNCLSPIDNFDWYDYLPPFLSPSQHPMHWAVDRIWDRNMTNS